MTMRSVPCIFVISILFVSLVFADEVAVESADAAAQGSVPARFAKGLEAAAADIQFPKYKKDISLNINCAARVSASGQVESYFCLDYQGGTDTKFRKVAEKFIVSAAFTPAVVDGEAVSVNVYFRVFFGRKGDLYAVGVFPNWADDVDKYGQEYEAPQRYNDDAPGPACGSVAGLSKVEVGVDGKATGDVSLVMSYGATEHYGTCENWYMQLVTDGSFIPAHHEGKPVAATYVEVGGDPDWFTLKMPEGV